MRRLKLVDAHADGLQLCNARVDTSEGVVEFAPEVGSKRASGMRTAVSGELLDLLDGQAEGAHGSDDFDAPQGFFAEQPVVALTAPARIQQPQLFVLAQRLDGHTGAL